MFVFSGGKCSGRVFGRSRIGCVGFVEVLFGVGYVFGIVETIKILFVYEEFSRWRRGFVFLNDLFYGLY